jgi:membrane protein
MTPTKEKFHFLRSWGPLFSDSFNGWIADHATRFSAALAYYAIFAMAPLVIIAISVAGLVFGEAAARGQIYDQVRSLLGQNGASEIQSLVKASNSTSGGIIGTVVGLIALLIGASGVFAQLKDALNSIWGVQLKPGTGTMTTVREYLLNFSMVLAIGFLLIISLMVSAALQAAKTLMTGLLPIPGFIIPITAIGTFLVLVLLFALIYKILPDVEIGWQDVWIGAIITAILFTIGKYLIGLYLGTSSIGSSFGAAGALILILVWVYYSSAIFFLGAEFTKSYADRFGSGINPASNACFSDPVRNRDSGLTDKKSEPELASAKAQG